MLVERISPMNSDILNELFFRYYQSAEKSHVTSSHWEKYGSKNLVKKSGDRIVVNGHGFGHFVRPGSLRHLKHCVPSFLSRQLLISFAVDKDIKVCGYDVARKQNRLLIFDEVKQIIICNILSRHDVLKQSNIIVVIGDGYGFMTCLLRLVAPQAKIICVNLGKMLLFDLLYASKVFPHTKMFLLQNNGNYSKTLEQYSMIFMEAEKYEMLLGREVDLFINIASMQEMNPDIIKTYFDIIRSSTGKRYFYSCNREEKVLPDGTVVRFNEYPWDSNKDEVIFDELCAFYQNYPISVPPFWLPFDGPMKHKLARMSQLSFAAVR